MSKTIVIAEKEPGDKPARLWFVRRWAAAEAWNLHVKWRSRAINAEAAVRHLKEELEREKEARRDEAKRADFYRRAADGRSQKLLRAQRELDAERAESARAENQANRFRLAWLSARRRANDLDRVTGVFERLSAVADRAWWAKEYPDCPDPSSLCADLHHNGRCRRPLPEVAK